MSDDKLPKWVKPLLEFGPVVAFAIAYVYTKDRNFPVGGMDIKGIVAVTALFVPLLLLCTGILWKLTGKISAMQILTAILVTIFGGLTVWRNDFEFIQMKPTFLYLIFGLILGVGLLRGRSYLRMVMEESLPMQDVGWMILTRRVTAFFFVMAALNEVVRYQFSDDIWMVFKTVGLPVLLFAFFMSQAGLLTKHSLKTED